MSVIKNKKPRPAAPRWRRRKEDRPAEIVAAALACFAEKGLAATRLEDIAARAGVTRGTLYLYFQGKEEIFKAVVRQSILPILARGEAMVAASDEPSATLLARLIENFPKAVLGSPVSALPKLVLTEVGNFPDLAEFYLEEVIRRGRRLIKALVKRGIDRGEFRPVDTALTVRLAMAPLVYAMIWKHSMIRCDQAQMDWNRFLEAHIEHFLRGLEATGPEHERRGIPS
jgi:AcrR family transcriptional regulator